MDRAVQAALDGLERTWQITYVNPWCVVLRAVDEMDCRQKTLETIYEVNSQFFTENDFVLGRPGTIAHWKLGLYCLIGIG